MRSHQTAHVNDKLLPLPIGTVCLKPGLYLDLHAGLAGGLGLSSETVLFVAVLYEWGRCPSGLIWTKRPVYELAYSSIGSG